MKITDSGYGDQYYAANGQDRDRPALRWYTSILRRNSNTNLRTLDFGSGAGFLTRRLSAQFKSVVAFDHSEHALKTTAKNCPSATVTSDLTQFADSTFGSIIAIHVLEHIASPTPILQEMNRLLRPGGTLLVVVPDLNGRGHKIRGENWFGFRDPTHCTLKPHSEWMDDFTAAGFQVNKHGTDGLWDGPYGNWRPRLINKVWSARGAALQVLTGRLFLNAGTGESYVAVLKKI